MQHDYFYYSQRAALLRGFARNVPAPNAQINHRRTLESLNFTSDGEMKSFVEFLRLVGKRRLIAELFNSISEDGREKFFCPPTQSELPNRHQARSLAETSAAPVASSN